MEYTTTYKDVLNWRGGALRRNVRNLILSTLSLNSKLDKNFKGVQFLYFHYIYNDEVNNAEKIIKWISDNFKVISYTEATERILNNTIDDYYICFSSDDGLKSNLVASKIFKKHNISCCFFINPETINNKDADFQDKVCRERLGVPYTEMLTWADINTLLVDGHEIGNHSFDHKVQGDLSVKDFEEDLTKSTLELKAKVETIEHYAYPRGHFKFFKKSYLKKTYDYGYKTCATAVRGCHVPQPKSTKIENIAIRRDVVVFYEPLSFLKYFLAKSQKNASISNTFWEN